MIEVEIEDDAWLSALPDAGALVRRAAEAALQGAGEVAIALSDDETVAELNQQFRNKAGPTNVLSFPSPEFARPFLGDVILAKGVCVREALEQDKPLADHVTHLVVHGVLHLRGHDHEDEGEAEAREALERTLLAGLGVPDPYNEPR